MERVNFGLDLVLGTVYNENNINQNYANITISRALSAMLSSLSF